MREILQQRLLEISDWKTKEKGIADGDSLRCLLGLLDPQENNYVTSKTLVVFFGIEKQAYDYIENAIRRLV